MRTSHVVSLTAYAVLFVKSIHAQGGLTGPTVTPTVSIVPGSTSLFSISKAASSIDLTSNFISGIPTSVSSATSTPTPQIIFVTGCNTCSSSGGAAATASIVNTTNEDQSKLSSNDLGAIIGGCAGGLVVIIIATVFLCIRRKKRRDFYAGRDFPTTAVIPPLDHDVKQQTYPASAVTKEPNQAISNNSFYIDNNDSTIKRYNLSSAAEDTAHDTITTPPVILYSDSLNNNNQQQQKMSMLDSGPSSTSPTPRPSRPLERKVSQGARLSKYNFLSQAFSQMRTSYAGDHPHNVISMNPTTTAPKSLNTDSSYNHDSMVLPHDKPKNQLYQQQQQGASFESMSPPPPPIPAMNSTSSFFDPNNTTRESTMTVATLHAPLFRQHQQHQQQRGTPSPSSIATARQKQPYTSHLAVSPTSPIRTAGIDADSVVSDVSQYSSKRSFSTTTSAALNQDNKPYPYF